jgi:hypothetical protein
MIGSDIRTSVDIKRFFVKYDKNHDEVLDATEISNNTIDRFDRDGDKKVTPAEIWRTLNPDDTDRSKTTAEVWLEDQETTKRILHDTPDTLPEDMRPRTKPVDIVVKTLQMFRVLLEVGERNSPYMPEPYDNWQANYQPGPVAVGDLDNKTVAYKLGLEFEPKIVNDEKLIVGIPISYYLENSDYARRWASWWDKVPLTDLELVKTSPALGVSIKYNRRVKFQLSAQTYKIICHDYAGDDRYGAKNWAHIIGSRTVNSGLGFRFDLRFEEFGQEAGFYLESNGGKIYQIGFTLGLSANN